jgi:hypothetical protein
MRCGSARALKASTQAGSAPAYQRLVEKRPVLTYQYACPDGRSPTRARPSGRMAPRSLRDTASTCERPSRSTSQSASVVPRKRRGEAGSPNPLSGATSGLSGSSTPRMLPMIPVERGKRPASTVACPGAVSVIA